MNISPRARAASVILIGVLLGAGIWWLSPKLTGETEPWDAAGNYYWIALLIAGFLSALASPRHFWLAPVGVYVGQFSYALVFLAIGPLLPIGLALGLAFSLLSLIGGAIAWGIVRLPAGVRDWRNRQRPESQSSDWRT